MTSPDLPAPSGAVAPAPAAPAPGATARPANVRRGLVLYLAVAFGVAWALWAVVALRGGPASPQTLALVTLSMFAPTLGTLAAWRWADPAALRVTGVRRRGPWRWYLLVYALIPALLLAGAALAVAVGVQQVDPTLGVLREMLRQIAAQAGVEPPPIPPFEIALVMTLPACLVAPLFNTVATIGEELGWRGYLLARLQPLGPRRAALAVGLIWGVWHAPIVAMGHNYPGEPVLGPPLMGGFTLVYGVILAWLRVRSGSVWPAALAHGALNAEAGVTVIFLTRASPLVGTPIGWVALLPAALVALALLRFGRWDAPADAPLSAPAGAPTPSLASGA